MAQLFKTEIEAFLKNTFLTCKSKKEILNKLESYGYEKGKDFKTEGNLESFFAYKKDTVAKYILVIVKEDKIAMFVNISSKRNTVILAYASNFEIPFGFKQYITDYEENREITERKVDRLTVNREILPFINKDKELNLFYEQVVERHMIEDITYSYPKYIENNIKRRFEEENETLPHEEQLDRNLVKKIHTRISNEEKERFLKEDINHYLFQKSSIKNLQLFSPSSLNRYMFANIRRYMITLIADKREFKNVSEKEKQRIRITLTRNMWRRNLFIRGAYSRTNDSNTRNIGYNFMHAYTSTPYFEKEVYEALIAYPELKTKYKFEKGEFEEFLESFYKSFLKLSWDIFVTKKDAMKFIETLIKRNKYEIENQKKALPLIYVAIKAELKEIYKKDIQLFLTKKEQDFRFIELKELFKGREYNTQDTRNNSEYIPF